MASAMALTTIGPRDLRPRARSTSKTHGTAQTKTTTIATYPNANVLKSRKGLNPGCGKSLPDLAVNTEDHIVASPLTCSPPNNVNAIIESDVECCRGATNLELAVTFATAK
eukprot:CAMPEP_0169414330 /NCGR_PEP_ID=MMETSP1017-20121227/61873_1 /TAXON_ID=342587 /ORGANISM="Karlodinium micrum, Strain CCMP2283" /LENGTH=110 /DNA_ID=CAMNT_0009521887 /DNA_START=110 /DNA_END=442 /DNA_ORIENTATION=+